MSTPYLPSATDMQVAGHHPITWCETCIAYAGERRDVLVPIVLRQAAVEDDAPSEVLLRYILKVHERHTAGLPILPERVS